jgi:DNA-binding SARP family transcriptional activator
MAPQTDGTDSSDHPDRQSELPKARVSVLGIPTIHGPDGEPMSGLRARAAQILTYLALTDRPGASTEKLIDATIEGPVRYKDGANRIHTDVANLRSVLAAACGDQHAPRAGYIRKSHDRYVIDADRVEIDLWQMRAAINQAAAAPDRPRRIAALQTAIGFYQGEFATGIDQLWVATGRTGVANEALGAVTDLAELYLDTDPHRSLGLLRRAIGWSPFTEDLYQRLMRVHHRMGNPDGIRTALHTLTLRLAEIGATPEKETTQMASQLLSTLGGRTRPTPA